MDQIVGSVERDELNIRKEVLLKRKRVLDAIDKLRQAGSSSNFVTTNLHFFVNQTGIARLPELQQIFDWINTKGIAKLSISTAGTSSAHGWGSYGVEVRISESFNNVLKETRQEYHSVNNALK